MVNERQPLNIGLSDLNKDDKYKVCFINGERVQITKGEDVMVKPIIKDIIKESDKNRIEGNRQDKILELN